MNIFTANPLQVVIDGAAYVFVGDVPENVRRSLKRAENGKFDGTLKQFYGAKWKVKLGLEKIGGVEKHPLLELIDEDEEIMGGDNSYVETQSDAEDLLELIDYGVSGGAGEEEVAGDIEEEIQNFLEENEDVLEEVAELERKTVNFVFINVYPHDKVSEFKRKVFLATGIPIYRQHIWYDRGRSYPLAYTVHTHSQLFPSLSEVLKSEDVIEGIPIGDHTSGRNMVVRAFDEYRVMSSYYHKGVVSFNLADLATYVDPSNPAHSQLIKSTNTMEIVYYGFVLPFWPMLTLQAFTGYLGEGLSDRFPLLELDKKELEKQVGMESSIVGEQFAMFDKANKKKLDNIRSKLNSSLLQSTISMMRHDMEDTRVNLRNLFDSLVLTSKMPACKCVAVNGGRYFTLNKSISKMLSDKMSPNSILIKLVLSNVQHSKLIIYKNGNYVIRSTWGEETGMDFQSVFDSLSGQVNSLLTKLNKRSDVVQKPLTLMTDHNIKFTEVAQSITYKRSIDSRGFDKFKDRILKQVDAGLMVLDQNDPHEITAFLTKGMYKFDTSLIDDVTESRNRYDYLSDGLARQKLFMLFGKSHLVKITHRYADIKIDVKGIKEDEYPIFYRTIVGLLNGLENAKSRTTEVKKKLKTLKEQDPVLYDARRMFGSDVIYSKICQKPYQPLLLNKGMFDRLDKEKKSRALKYWNFTSQDTAYYLCPNPKHPYVKFLVNRHPKGYCIPCCKKIEITKDTTDAKKLIHETCLRDRKFEGKVKSVVSRSKYIMSFGKDIDAGRLSRLPEDTLEPLFYETLSGQRDADCEQSEGYYLYGVPQNNNTSFIGMLFCLANALDQSTSSILTTFINGLKGQPLFDTLLKGMASKYFTKSSLISNLAALKANEQVVDAPWNEVFIELAEQLYEINVVVFSTNPVRMNIPPHLMDTSKFLDPVRRCLVVVKKEDNYYPLYLLNSDIFFKSGIVETKLFAFGSHIMLIIENVIRKFLAAEKMPSGVTHKKFDLFAVEKFAESSAMSIKKLYVNSASMCYGVEIGEVLLPIEESHCGRENREFSPFTRKTAPRLNTLNTFLKKYNKWAAPDGIPKFPVISAEKWIVFGGKVIGFTFRRITFYFKPVPITTAKKLKKIPIVTLLYDPDKVNMAIYNKDPPKSDHRVKNLDAYHYKFYAYKQYLTRFMRLFSSTKNTVMRRKLKKVLVRTAKPDINKSLSELSSSDEKKVKMMMSDFMTHRSKKTLLEAVDSARFDFDDTQQSKILNSRNPIAVVKAMAKKFISHAPFKGEVKNMINIDGKLHIDKKTASEFAEIFLSDLENPLKRTLIFSSVATDPVIKFFQFVRRPMEEIVVEPFEF